MFPKQADNNFQGHRIAALVFLLITFVTIARSLIHIFAPDGCAGSIAGIDLSVAGGSNIISMFAFWGLSQLLMGIVYLVVYFRYKSLIPLMYVLILAEIFGKNASRIHQAFGSNTYSTGSDWRLYSGSLSSYFANIITQKIKKKRELYSTCNLSRLTASR